MMWNRKDIASGTMLRKYNNTASGVRTCENKDLQKDRGQLFRHYARSIIYIYFHL